MRPFITGFADELVKLAVIAAPGVKPPGSRPSMPAPKPAMSVAPKRQIMSSGPAPPKRVVRALPQYVKKPPAPPPPAAAGRRRRTAKSPAKPKLDLSKRRMFLADPGQSPDKTIKQHNLRMEPARNLVKNVRNYRAGTKAIAKDVAWEKKQRGGGPKLTPTARSQRDAAIKQRYKPQNVFARGERITGQIPTDVRRSRLAQLKKSTKKVMEGGRLAEQDKKFKWHREQSPLYVGSDR